MTHAMFNGGLVPLEEARVSVLDRSFLYGDGLFETLRVCHATPFRWPQHLERLAAGAHALGIRLPFHAEDLRQQASDLIGRNGATDSILRLHLSRGVGARGYSPRGADQPLLVMTSHPAPVLNPEHMVEFKVIVSPWRLPEGDPLGRWKSANKLLNILARKAADEAGADEALILNSRGEVCEASSANLFWMEGGQLFTPPSGAGVLPGVTRSVILELAEQAGRTVHQTLCAPARLGKADAVFLTQSALGVIRVCQLEQQRLKGRRQATEWHAAYQHVVEAECRF